MELIKYDTIVGGIDVSNKKENETKFWGFHFSHVANRSIYFII